MDEFSVVSADDSESVRARVERIYHEFGEPVLVERYIGGKDAQELTVPMLFSHDGFPLRRSAPPRGSWKSTEGGDDDDKRD